MTTSPEDTRDMVDTPPSAWSFAWLIVKVLFFILATFEALEIVVVAYQRF